MNTSTTSTNKLENSLDLLRTFVAMLFEHFVFFILTFTIMMGAVYVLSR